MDPLPWCPHLDAVKPLPPSGVDIFKPCQDCGSEAENWICLTCYQVTRLTEGRCHMSHGGVSPELCPLAGLLWPLRERAHGESRRGGGTPCGAELFGPVGVVLPVRGLRSQPGDSGTAGTW